MNDKQFGLFDPPRSHRNDPMTSHVAAVRVREFDGDMYLRIRAGLKLGPGTKREIAQRLGLLEEQVHKRLTELERGGIIRVQLDRMGNEVTAPGKSGRQQRVWELVCAT